MNTKDTPIDYKQFEGHTPEKQAEHFQLYDAISKIPNGLDFLKAVNAGIDENKSLKLELQKQKEEFSNVRTLLNNMNKQLMDDLVKQKELNAELVKKEGTIKLEIQSIACDKDTPRNISGKLYRLLTEIID